MKSLDIVDPDAEAEVRAAVTEMFQKIKSTENPGAPLNRSGSQILGLKDQAKALLQSTPGLQLPNDLLLYARTLSYLFALGEELDPQVDLMKISTPYLLQFLAGKE